MVTISPKCLIASLVLAFLAPAFAGGVNCSNTPCSHHGGRVNESSAVPADFVVHISGRDGREVFFPGFPKLLHGVLNPATGNYEAHTFAPNDHDAYDAWNDTIIKVAAGGVGNPGGGGGGGGGLVNARSVLYIESTFTDLQGFITLTPIFETLFANRGYGAVTVPDLYISDANGRLVNDGVLYSLVDLSYYLDGPPTFQFGDIFRIDNGLVAGLPGMRFSTVPFVFDDLGGTGFSAPAFSGYASAITLHTITNVPEPAIPAMLLLGIAVVGATARRQSKLP